ncbi:MAG: oligosaccharide flippase family protein [Desulfuromonadales bacterium]|nr:oligosaccharide flippase family protein [Desulfuromonadales bacterium]
MASVEKESRLLAKNSAIYGAGTLLNGIAAFLLLPIYTRYLTPYDYGIKELVGLSLEVVGILVSTGISGAVFRFYFQYDNEKDRRLFLSTSITALFFLGFLAFGGLSLASGRLAFYLLDSASLYHFFIIGLLSLVFQSVNNVGLLYLRIQHKAYKFVGYSLLRLVLAIALNIYFICWLKVGVVGILLSTLITALIMNLLLIWPLLFQVGVHFSYAHFREMLSFGLPLIPGNLANFVVHLSSRFFLKGYCSIADAGLYSLGSRFGNIPSNFISVPFNQAWQPRRFEMYKAEHSEKIFGKVFTYFLLIMAFGGLMVSVLAPDIIRLMATPEFWPAGSIVPIIVLSSIVLSLQYHFDMGLWLEKKSKHLAAINIANACFVIVMNFLLIPTYGVVGAAVANLASMIFRVGLTYYFSSRFYRIYFEFRRISKIVGAAVTLFGASQFIEPTNILFALSAHFLLTLVFPFLLYVLQFFNPEEKEKVLGFIRPKLPLFMKS